MSSSRHKLVMIAVCANVAPEAFQRVLLPPLWHLIVGDIVRDADPAVKPQMNVIYPCRKLIT